MSKPEFEEGQIVRVRPWDEMKNFPFGTTEAKNSIKEICNTEVTIVEVYEPDEYDGQAYEIDPDPKGGFVLFEEQLTDVLEDIDEILIELDEKHRQEFKDLLKVRQDELTKNLARNKVIRYDVKKIKEWL